MKIVKLMLIFGMLGLLTAPQIMAVQYEVNIELHNPMIYSLYGPNGYIGEVNTGQTVRTEYLEPGTYLIAIPYGGTPAFQVENDGNLTSLDNELKIEIATRKVIVMNNKWVTIKWTKPIDNYRVYGIASGNLNAQIYKSNNYLNENYLLAVGYGPAIGFELVKGMINSVSHPDALVDKKDLILLNTRSIKIIFDQIPSGGYWLGGYSPIIYNTQTNVHDNLLSGRVLLKVGYEPAIVFSLNTNNTLTPNSNSPTPITQIDAYTLQAVVGGITVTITTNI